LFVDRVISASFFGKILEIEIDGVHVGASEIPMTSNAVFANIDLAGGVSDQIDLFQLAT
jgi:hypothetical protein